MLPSSHANAIEPRQRHWLLRALLVLLGAQLSLSLLAAWTGPALAGQQQVVTLELLGIALWQGLWVLLRSLPLLLLLLWPLLRVLGPRRRWWAFASIGTLWLLLQAALELAAGCPCERGCLACVGPILEHDYALDTKQLSIALLRAMVGGIEDGRLKMEETML